MRLFRMETTTAAGQPWTSRAWYAEFRDHEGRLRRMALFTDKALSDSFLRRMGQLVEYRRAGFEAAAHLQQWAMSLPGPMLGKLMRIGLLAPGQEHERATVEEHIAAYLTALRARGRVPRHVETVAAILGKLRTALGLKRLSELTVERVYQYLADRRACNTEDAPRLSATTCNHYIKTVRAFTHWLVGDRRLPADPLQGLVRLDAVGDRHRRRRALTVAEMTRLLEVTAAGARRWNMPGADRALLYRLAAATGLRSGALRVLTRTSLDLEGTPATVEVAAKRRIHRLPLPVGLVGSLRQLVARRAAGEPLFRMPARTNVARMFRQDLADAGIGLRDHAGRVLDFHSLRRTFATRLYEAGVRPALAQRVMGHSTVDLTLNWYTDIGLDDELRAIEAVQTLGATDSARVRRPARRRKRRSEARQEVTRRGSAKGQAKRKPRKKR